MHIIRILIVPALLAAPAATSAQSLLERPANLSGNWTGASGTIYFHFLHRFAASSAPERKVSNVPTFLLAAGLPQQLLAGFNYSTNSSLAPRFPNEWELFARWSPVGQDHGAPVDLGGQIGYNNAADGVDGEVSVARRFGAARLIAAARALADPIDGGNVRFALAGGATLRFGRHVALAGDIASLTGREAAEKVAWSAGLHAAIPLTPHTVSFQVTNATVGTLQGASRGSDDVRFGFEFTIPLTLRRYFGRRAEPPVTEVVPPPAAGAEEAAVGISNLNYLKPRLEVTTGTTVVWTNHDAVAHTVTATDHSFDSGLIQPGKTYRRTFTKPGTYDYFCTPHPFMKATITVE